MKGNHIKVVIALCLLIMLSVKIRLEGTSYSSDTSFAKVTVRAQGVKRVFSQCNFSSDGTVLACINNDSPEIWHIFSGNYYVIGTRNKKN